jgi:hypothetical protein
MSGRKPRGRLSGASFMRDPLCHPAVLIGRAARTIMNQLLLQVVIVVAFGAFCFGCGYLTSS